MLCILRVWTNVREPVTTVTVLHRAVSLPGLFASRPTAPMVLCKIPVCYLAKAVCCAWQSCQHAWERVCPRQEDTPLLAAKSPQTREVRESRLRSDITFCACELRGKTWGGLRHNRLPSLEKILHQQFPSPQL